MFLGYVLFKISRSHPVQMFICKVGLAMFNCMEKVHAWTENCLESDSCIISIDALFSLSAHLSSLHVL